MNNLNMQMHVPEHIYLGGDDCNNVGHCLKRGRSQSATRAEVLSVPDRITLGGGGTHFGSKVNPGKDSMRDKLDAITVQESSDVPLVITVSETSYIDSHSAPILHSQSSTAIDENPIKELKVMRRKLGYISTRLLDLEEEFARRQTREIGLWAVLAGTIFALASLFVNRRR